METGEGAMAARVVLAMSGGVDSSVAALLLRRQGYDVVGLFMRTGAHGGDDRPDRKKGCCSALDAGDARRVADRLDLPFYALDFERDFKRIMDYFVEEYTLGRTPNPCVVCNTWLKFGKLWSYGKQLQADFIATGNYAAGSRRYVLDIIPATNDVVLGDREELLAPSLVASRVNWLIEPPAASLRCQAKIRYRHQAATATAHPLADNAVRVEFDEPQSAITPGQAVVFYDGD